LRQRRDIGLQAIGDSEAGGIVRTSVDALARRQLFQRIIQRGAGQVQFVLRFQ
jgi:hypothetical protein